MYIKLNLVKHPSIFNFERSDIFSMLEVLIVGSILTYFILIPLFQKVLSCYNKKNDKHYLSEDREQYRILYQKYSIYSWAGLIILILTCLMPYSTHIIHQNPFIW